MTEQQEWQQMVAQMMRETADLVAQGLVHVTQIDFDEGVGHFDSWSGVRHLFYTGRREVRITIVGHSGTRMPDWGAARQPYNALPPSQKLLR